MLELEEDLLVVDATVIVQEADVGSLVRMLVLLAFFHLCVELVRLDGRNKRSVAIWNADAVVYMSPNSIVHIWINNFVNLLIQFSQRKPDRKIID